MTKSNRDIEYPREKVVIDARGNVCITPKFVNSDYYFGSYDYCNGVGSIEVNPRAADGGYEYEKNNDYYALINSKGDIICTDGEWEDVTSFSHNRAFVQFEDHTWKMINKQGDYISNLVLYNIVQNSFKGTEMFADDFAVVKLNGGWVKVDTTGKVLSKPIKFVGFTETEMNRSKDYVFFKGTLSKPKGSYSIYTGIWNLKTNFIVDPIYNDFDMYAFGDGLNHALRNGKECYFNSKGEVIWEGEKEVPLMGLYNLNIDYMCRGYFRAYSEPIRGEGGGFASSNNLSNEIGVLNHFQPGILSVEVHPEERDTIFRNYNAMTVYLANDTEEDVMFAAQDSRLDMKVQALNSKGQWCDIEFLGNSWCGNSYHTLTLESKHYWQFLTPVYEGDFKTKLRVAVTYRNPNADPESDQIERGITIYSNEYDGNINLGQFWKKMQYYPNGIMDPYFD